VQFGYALNYLIDIENAVIVACGTGTANGYFRTPIFWLVGNPRLHAI
jgi:hypothetical protein